MIQIFEKESWLRTLHISKNLGKVGIKQGGRGHKSVNRFKYIKTGPAPVNFDNNARNIWEALCKILMPK